METTFEKIPSFKIDHTKLLPGLYVSRIDKVGNEPVTTYDIRLVRPNKGQEFSPGAMHALEHLGAYYLRNQPDVKEKILYFGPMGCRTGLFAMAGYYEPLELVPLLRSAFNYINTRLFRAPRKRVRQLPIWVAEAKLRKVLRNFVNPTAHKRNIR